MNGLDLSPHTRAGPGLRRNSGTVLFGFFWFQINWGCCCKRLARFWLPVIALWYFRGLVWLLEVSTDALSLSTEIKTWPSVFIDECNLWYSWLLPTLIILIVIRVKSLPVDLMSLSFPVPSTSFGQPWLSQHMYSAASSSVLIPCLMAAVWTVSFSCLVASNWSHPFVYIPLWIYLRTTFLPSSLFSLFLNFLFIQWDWSWVTLSTAIKFRSS